MINDIIRAWAHGGPLNKGEAKALGLRSQEADKVDALLRDGYLTLDEINKSGLRKSLREVFLSVAQQNPFAPISAYLEYMEGKSQNDFECYQQNPFLLFEMMMSDAPQELAKAPRQLVHDLFQLSLELGRSPEHCWGYPRELLKTFEHAGLEWASMVYPLLQSSEPHERALAVQWLRQRHCANMVYPPEAETALENLAARDPQEKVQLEARKTLAIYEFCQSSLAEMFLAAEPIYQGALTCLDPQSVRLVDDINASRTGMLEGYHILGATHPMFQIVHYSPNDFVLDDFRSATILESIAQHHWTDEMVQDRILTMVYPGAGSHLGPLVVALSLIDQDKIDFAHLTYTDLEPANVRRVEEYLRWFERKGLISGLERVDQPEGEGMKHYFRFAYKDKVVELQYLINLGEADLWTTADSLANVDLVLFHDGPPLQVQLNIVKKLHAAKSNGNDRPRFIITGRDHFEDFPPQRGESPSYMLDNKYSLKGLPFDGKEPLPYEPLEGGFGCYGSDKKPRTLFRQTAHGVYEDDRNLSFQSYPYDPEGKLSYHASPSADRGAYLVRVPQT